MCCSPWCRKEEDTTERATELKQSGKFLEIFLRLKTSTSRWHIPGISPMSLSRTHLEIWIRIRIPFPIIRIISTDLQQRISCH